MFSVTLLGSTTTEVNVTGCKQKGAGYSSTIGCNHTVSIAVSNFIGRIYIEGSLASEPCDNDWFPIPLIGFFDFLQFPQNQQAPTGQGGGDTGVVSYSFSGNYIWIRARLDRTYLNPAPNNADLVGAIRYILLNYGAVGNFSNKSNLNNDWNSNQNWNYNQNCSNSNVYCATNYSPWGIPWGGATGQLLVKNSNVNLDTTWATRNQTYIANAAPTGVNNGDFWWNDNINNLFIQYANSWVISSNGAIGPTGPLGPTGPIATTGNITITDQTIAGADSNGNIIISPNGSGNVVINQNSRLVIANAAASTSTTTGALIVNGGIGIVGNAYIGSINLQPGNSSLAPLGLTAGTLVTQPAAGSIEYNGSEFYATPSNLQRGLIPTEQLYVLGQGRTLPNTANVAYNLFTLSSTVSSNTKYFYEIQAAVLSNVTIGGGAIQYALAGNALIVEHDYVALTTSNVNRYIPTATNMVSANLLTGISTLTTITANSGIGNFWYNLNISGIIGIGTGGGTVTPQIAVGPGNTLNEFEVAQGSWMKIYPVGSNSGNLAIGNWQ